MPNKKKSRKTKEKEVRASQENFKVILASDARKDPLFLSYSYILEQTGKLFLTDLELWVKSLLKSLETNDEKELVAYYDFIRNTSTSTLQPNDPKRPKPAATRKALEIHAEEIKHALHCYNSSAFAKSVSADVDATKRVMRLLGPQNPLDWQLRFYAAQKAFMNRPDRGIKEFEKSNPLEEFKSQQDVGFLSAKEKARMLENSEEANSLGRLAWTRGFKWTAECFWSKAIEIQDQAKYRSNRAFARTTLGRDLRSRGIGYRRFAEILLLGASVDAAKAIELDSTWERGYIRSAEAYLSRGPYDCAQKAWDIIQSGMGAIEIVSDTLKQLGEKAKRNADLWSSVIKNERSIPDIIRTAVQNLRASIVRGLCAEVVGINDATKMGDEIADGAEVIFGALQLIYLRRDQWKQELRKDYLETDVQMELREAAKLVPLKAVLYSERLRRFIFAEEPFQYWGLNCLDRVGVDYLPPKAKDPCENDEDTGEIGAMFNTMVSRQSDTPYVDMEKAADMVEGEGPKSFNVDYSPHHMCSFSITIMQRMIMKNNAPLHEMACSTIKNMGLFVTKGAWAGGDFFGLALHVLTGIGKCGIPSDPIRTEKFLKTKYGVAALAQEICLSGDDHSYIQDVLVKNMSPDDWAEQSAYDIKVLLGTYLLPGIDNRVLALKPEKISQHVISILASLLEGHPEAVDFIRDGPDDLNPNNLSSKVLSFMPLFQHAFGLYVVRKFMYYDQKLKAKMGSQFEIVHVVKKLVESWMSLDFSERESYRWELLDDETKKNLAVFAPIDRSEFKKVKSKSKQNDSEKKHHCKIPMLPQCAYCGIGEGMGVELSKCVCKLVQYCNTNDCQKKHWPEHKKNCNYRKK